jgi:hypothetical protein
MKKSDWPKFYALIRSADEVISVKRSEAAISLMFEALTKYSVEDVELALRQHVKQSPYQVKPADIVAHIEGLPEERSLLAWRTFLRALDRYGYYESVRFPDPAYHYVILQLGGWTRLCDEFHGLSDRELQFRSKGWRQMYEIGLRKASWSDEPGMAAMPLYLPGFYELDNREKGFLYCVPAVIDAVTGEKLDLDKLKELYWSGGDAKTRLGRNADEAM